MERYVERLAEVRVRLGERECVARGKLEAYEEAGVKDMEGLVGRYAGLLRDVEGVKADIRRLGGEV